ncbi:hypothetical protein [Treponema pallidum]|uniref:Uncharacterized lipoprotein TP_0693 n=4 Tax=Treponema pallidum TaxID=160 RepID=Y693_TREPA|nr:hypothetical protein [Treponema pallidum]O83691.1 RecName: Full=Uncharacterized lipoprotein TP_0693; Flags: Precursor [Treponema pallidum subsp. pallidum str. Nichols]AAC65665.1 predicted coding region TP0693 [Treponema pallidum subsp. pallidum str. Nichols]ACD71111.1 hypothetical protein TPASS_0693 [Treponema pallidum subsp. pallidum SS14]ADD72794.1 lipoprotein, putative [Treponema pallidum subsp. pallidum str. Chicago]AEZ57819.1 probable lipoprotein [Treponema pallidum subsp. pertenue str
MDRFFCTVWVWSVLFGACTSQTRSSFSLNADGLNSSGVAHASEHVSHAAAMGNEAGAADASVSESPASFSPGRGSAWVQGTVGHIPAEHHAALQAFFDTEEGMRITDALCTGDTYAAFNELEALYDPSSETDTARSRALHAYVRALLQGIRLAPRVAPPTHVGVSATLQYRDSVWPLQRGRFTLCYQIGPEHGDVMQVTLCADTQGVLFFPFPSAALSQEVTLSFDTAALVHAPSLCAQDSALQERPSSPEPVVSTIPSPEGEENSAAGEPALANLVCRVAAPSSDPKQHPVRRQVSTTICILDYGKTGRPLTHENLTATRLLGGLLKRRFVNIGLDSLYGVGKVPDHAVIARARKKFGGNVRRLVFGLTQVRRLERDSDARWKCVLFAQLHVWDFPKGAYTHHFTAQCTETGDTESQSYVRARTRMGETVLSDVLQCFL